MLNKEILSKFRNGSTDFNKDRASSEIATKLVETAIQKEVTGNMPSKCIYKDAVIAYESGEYLVIGMIGSDMSGHELRFKEDFSEIGFHNNMGIIQFTPDEELKELLTACVDNIKAKARRLETAMATAYLASSPDGVRFGTEDYLEEEFKEYIQEQFNEMNSVMHRKVEDSYPFDFNLKGDIAKYFADHGIKCGKALHVLVCKD